ncbi:hypothetical protein ACF061_00775 [Streptomyces sp. NPDC015220]|uniref:hypothetical protein n=1 Tax=Streptomyces sp. NPDC015220 TaxID=3364947 RepID=UPI0036FEC050
MPAKFSSAHCTINWQGVDDDTPPGHSIATGTDSLGTPYMWLFKGGQPTDDAFVGSISIPCVPNQSTCAYGRGGGFAGTVTDYATALARLAERAADEA